MAVASILLSVMDPVRFDEMSGVQLRGCDPDFCSDPVHPPHEDLLPGTNAVMSGDPQQKPARAQKRKSTFSTLETKNGSAMAFELEQALSEGCPDVSLGRPLFQRIDQIRVDASGVFERCHSLKVVTGVNDIQTHHTTVPMDTP